MEDMTHKDFLISCSKGYFSQLFADKASHRSKLYSYTLDEDKNIKNDWKISKEIPELTFYWSNKQSKWS